MFRRRRLGVREANAIDDIVAFEWKWEQGITPSPDEEDAYREAWKVVECRGTRQKVTRSQSVVSTYDDTEYWADEPEDEVPPPFNYMCPTVIGDPVRVMAWALLGFIAWIILASIYHVYSY